MGFFPLDKAIGLTEKHWSPRLTQKIVWLCGLLPYGTVVEVLAEIGHIDISKSSVWRLSQRWGRRMSATLVAEESEVKAAAREWSTPGGREAMPGRMGLAVDGAMLCLKEEGWKEFRVGCVFTVGTQARTDPQTGDVEQYGHAENMSYRAQLSTAEAFGWPMWTEANRRRWQTATDTLVLGDGAPWIWKMRDDHFPGSEMLVDWYHAIEHLGQAKQLRYPEGGPISQRWFNRLKLQLYQGHTDRVVRSIKHAANVVPDQPTSEALLKEAHYFCNNQRRMQYQDCRNAGWPIGSGMVESAAKQFKARVSGPGMRWSRSGASHILSICAVSRSGKKRFEDVWVRAEKSPDF